MVGSAVQIRVIQDVKGLTANEQATGLQDLLILFERAVATVTHLFVYSRMKYMSRRQSQEHEVTSRHTIWNIVDFKEVLSGANVWFHGGAGYEFKLIDEAPITPYIGLGVTRTTLGMSSKAVLLANRAAVADKRSKYQGINNKKFNLNKGKKGSVIMIRGKHQH